MPAINPITIVGGGLAGLALGIGLRQHSVPVLIREAGDYPRHRVCGEFISGQGQSALRNLNLLELFHNAGARVASTSAFFSASKSFPVRALPQPAICLSRFVLDDLLAKKFLHSGGEMVRGLRWQEGELGAGVVRASGRRSRAVENGWRWFGLKAHAQKVNLSADLEMHLVPQGYVGLCRLKNGETNVCGLFRRRKDEPNVSQGIVERLRDKAGSILHERLKFAVWDEQSICAVGGLSLSPRCVRTLDECCIGDALTMIPPITGNGMSMAFESAEIALLPLVAYSKGEISWEAARQAINERCDLHFARRLRVAKWLQRGLFQPWFQTMVLPMALNWNALWKLTFAVTR